MITLIRKTTQSSYTFAVPRDQGGEYIANLTYNDQSGSRIRSSVSFEGEEVDDDKKDEVVDLIARVYEHELPVKK